MERRLFWKYLKYVITNKYLIVVLIFVFNSLFFDQHNWVKRLKTRHKIAELESDIDYYKKKIDDDKKQIQKYSLSTEELEKIAREAYFMKCPEEEIFVIK